MTPHVAVCICTFKRPALLLELLEGLARQRTDGRFTYSAVVADNDADRSAEAAVQRFAASAAFPIRYCVEPEQNIALARNRALANADGDFIAFIDDDEVPVETWLHSLLEVCETHRVDGVMGPVNPRFETPPPAWATRGRFFERPQHPTGYTMPWPEARSGNVLFRRSILEGFGTPFRPQFATAGEDVDFFRRMMERGSTFVWCAEAVVNEVVPPSRCTKAYLLRRALLRGSNFPKHPRERLKNASKSLIAVPSYAVALPVLALFGEHVFLKYLIKLLDHAARLLAFAGVPLVRERHT